MDDPQALYVSTSFYSYLTYVLICFIHKLWSKYKIYWFSHINIFQKKCAFIGFSSKICNKSKEMKTLQFSLIQSQGRNCWEGNCPPPRFQVATYAPESVNIFLENNEYILQDIQVLTYFINYPSDSDEDELEEEEDYEGEDGEGEEDFEEEVKQYRNQTQYNNHSRLKTTASKSQ